MLAGLEQSQYATNACGRKTLLRGLQVAETRKEELLSSCLCTIITAFPKLSCLLRAVFTSLFLLFLRIFLSFSSWTFSLKYKQWLVIIIGVLDMSAYNRELGEVKKKKLISFSLPVSFS